MRAYVLTSGILFGLLFAAHVARVSVEGTGTLHDPFFVASSLVALLMALWCLRVVRR